MVQHHPKIERLYLDFDSFFASAEQHFNADLRGRPIGVVPMDSPYTSCIAVSREAKKLGVKGGMTIKDARALVPSMIFVVARHDVYVRLHHRICAVIEAIVPIAKVRSIDEVVCHLLPSEARSGRALAHNIKTALAIEFSVGLTCSIGLAPTELLSKIAAEMQKPDGLVVLEACDLPDKIAHLPLSDLPGVSNGMETRLNAAGVDSVSALWNLAPKHARAIWRSVEGERFWNELHGFHAGKPETVKRMFGHSRLLPPDWRTPDKVRTCAQQLAGSAGLRLRRADLRATKLSLGLRGGEGSTSLSRRDKVRWGWEASFQPARDDHTFLSTLANGLDIAQQQVSFQPRSVSVMLHGLTSDNDMTEDLFRHAVSVEGAPSVEDQRKKWEVVSDVMDQLKTKMGPDAISLGKRAEVPGGYLGAKIAFGRIPELSDFRGAPVPDHQTHFCKL